MRETGEEIIILLSFFSLSVSPWFYLHEEYIAVARAQRHINTSSDPKLNKRTIDKDCQINLIRFLTNIHSHFSSLKGYFLTELSDMNSWYEGVCLPLPSKVHQ